MDNKRADILHAAFRWAILLAALVVLSIYAVNKYYKPYNVTPTFTDNFGYANMARAIDRGTWLDDHTQRPYLDGLLSYLQGKGYPHAYLDLSLTAQGYHIDEKSGRPVNHYHPGVALLISVFPVEWRFHLFPIVVIIFFFIPIVAAILLSRRRLTYPMLALLIGLCYWMVEYQEKTIIGFGLSSFSPTYGLMIGAAWLLYHRSALMFVFLGLTMVFRMSNIVYTLPFFAVWFYTFWKDYPHKYKKRLLIQFARKGLYAFFLFFVSGFGFYLWYAWQVTGSPLRMIAPAHDSELVWGDAMIQNIKGYMNVDTPWFLPHLAVLIISLAVFYRRYRWQAFILGIYVFTYILYFTHMVYVPQYIYSSPCILAGLALAGLAGHIEKTRPALKKTLSYASIAFSVGLLVYLTAINEKPGYRAREKYTELKAVFDRAFAPYDAVWIYNTGSPVEYLTGVPIIPLEGTRPEVYYDMFYWLHHHGYDQAIWASEIQGKVNLRLVLQNLQANGIPVQQKTDPALGSVFVIPGKDKP